MNSSDAELKKSAHNLRGLMLREETKTTLIDLCTYEIISDDDIPSV